MKEKDIQKEQKLDKEIICPIVDKCELIIKLKTLIGESKDIAEYIDENVQYGRALGYAEGKRSAYLEIASLVLSGEFDCDLWEDEDGYEM